jgi:hypothetical protein
MATNKKVVVYEKRGIVMEQNQPNLLNPLKVCKCGIRLYSRDDIYMIIRDYKPEYMCHSCYLKEKKK